MSQTTEEPLIFEEFARLNGGGHYELVNGRLEELAASRPRHSWTGGRIAGELGRYLDAREPGCFYGLALDIPTAPCCGRRPDFAYYSAADAASRVDLNQDLIIGAPTLVAEVVSPDDENRDLITKRREYAEAGIAHYWILDPEPKTVLTLALTGAAYVVVGQFSGEDTLVSDLFPGLQIPLSRLFR